MSSGLPYIFGGRHSIASDPASFTAFGRLLVDRLMALMYVNLPALSCTQAGSYAESKFSHLMFI